MPHTFIFLASWLYQNKLIKHLLHTISDLAELYYGVPQSSVLGPILFILYTHPLTRVILNHPVCHMLYADDTQVYKFCNL